ncbi:acyl-CoA dehydrogenase [Azospirillum sp.]|uniref:acyl-CoA dehydrogenase n=1 Tax=Azospirillum sp. TaxID=34012 RepID=UPI002D33BF15|nr:acyl-CoA dehydrogenase C-terminal domain-containing protein [Azospirillum sp.]HYD65567.1 acyl-CoA dehydrogenase C-terminal domain-containing protein [Azospirillum sp.]
MPAYKAPVEDMVYLLGELFDAEGVLAPLCGENASLDLMSAVLGEAARFCEEVVHPLNRTGDEEGCHFDAGSVRTPKGVKEAFAAFVENGWVSLSGDPEYGGQGMPRVVQVLTDEMLSSANLSFGLFPGLTHGATEAIRHHASDALKALYLPKMVAGTWTGAMDLTEAHAGTDLGLLRTRAEPQDDGSYRITGTKIFISAGDHDLAENIIHLVLARLPGAPAGTQGISLFLVPKFIPDADGNPGVRNAFAAGAIEHKMGIKGSPTCVMNFDGATGWLVGEPNKGLAAMFTMMNNERLFVGIQGLGAAEAAYQGAAAYAKDRLQGRAPAGGPGPQPILVHPDVRKNLLTVRAFTEAGRALAVWTALEMEKAERHPDTGVRAAADDLVALMTPVIKAAFSDLGFEGAVLAQQVFGGHGYIREHGMEQLVRDARITQIYEGTNGVQAMDLVGRKLTMAGGRLPERFFALVGDVLQAGEGVPGAGEFVAPLRGALTRLKTTTARLKDRAAADPAEAGAAATDYLRLFALTALGWMWARMALHALAQGEAAGPRHRAKLEVARFFMARVLPQTVALELALDAGAASLMSLDADAF